MFKGLLSRLLRDRRGNILMIYALSAPIVLLAVGFAVDFGRAAQLRTKLNAAADAAALVALTPAMMVQNNATAQAAAVTMFNAQAGSVSGLYGAAAVTVTITNPNNNALDRIVQVCYSAAEATIFSGILGASSLPLGDCATAQAQIPPNINFYLLLDNSPSMQLPATQAGITQMQSLTPYQDGGNGCAFACHQYSTNNGDTTGNTCTASGASPVYVGTSSGTQLYYCTTTKGSKCSDGSTPSTIVYSGVTYYYCTVGAQIDNFQLSRNNNIQLRLDQLTSAVSTLMQTAQNTANSTPYNPPPTYQFAVNSMDSSWQIGFQNLMALTPSYISGWASAASSFGVMEMFDNNNVCGNSSCNTSGGTGDVATNYDNAMSSANAQMPNPGKGTNASGDLPQEVLFIVTDGVEDETNGGVRLIQQINAGTSTNYCSTIKGRGIKIAVLYTEYLPVPANSFYVGNVEPFQPNIGPALQACASPGLFYDAAIGSDLSQALATLFQAAVQSANLTQ